MKASQYRLSVDTLQMIDSMALFSTAGSSTKSSMLANSMSVISSGLSSVNWFMILRRARTRESTRTLLGTSTWNSVRGGMTCSFSAITLLCSSMNSFSLS